MNPDITYPPVTDCIRRWNLEATDTDIMVCRDHHAKGLPCEMERLEPREAVQIIEDLRSAVILLSRKNAALRAPRTVAKFAYAPTTLSTSIEVLCWDKTQPIFPIVAPFPV